jgi:hypothetical protein
MKKVPYIKYTLIDILFPSALLFTVTNPAAYATFPPLQVADSPRSVLIILSSVIRPNFKSLCRVSNFIHVKSFLVQPFLVNTDTEEGLDKTKGCKVMWCPLPGN